ncbi:tRNA (adenine(22)-N(1))-methyltransferase TrmK [Caldicellulosiruptoraceae bacterium PP1]
MLSKRLSAIFELIDNCYCLGDIGTDHGYIPVQAILTKKAQKAIATDLNIKPLNKAREYAIKKGVADKIEFRLGNGIEIIEKDECQNMVIAGMGGSLIKDILKDSINKIVNTKLILQPMKDIKELREWLYKNGFSIDYEVVIEDSNKFYIIIIANFKNAFINYSQKDIDIGTFYKYKFGDIEKEYLKYLYKINLNIMNNKKLNNIDYKEQENVIMYIKEVINI